MLQLVVTGKTISLVVVSMTANLYLRIRHVEGFCDNVAPQKKETVQNRKTRERVLRSCDNNAKV